MRFGNPFSVESKLAHDPAVKILVLTDTGHFPHTNIGANVVLKCSNYVKLGEFEVITPQGRNKHTTFIDMVLLFIHHHHHHHNYPQPQYYLSQNMNCTL